MLLRPLAFADKITVFIALELEAPLLQQMLRFLIDCLIDTDVEKNNAKDGYSKTTILSLLSVS